jgi:phosphatidylinositol alpha 1,6-mannosyltransferase
LCVPPLRELKRRLIAEDVRVIHAASSGLAGLSARYLARRTGVPLIGSVHTPPAPDRPGTAWRAGMQRRYARWFYGGCRRVLVPSAEIARRLCGLSASADRWMVWPRGVEATEFTPSRRSARLREHWRVSDRRPAILFCGRLARAKGLGLIEPLGSLLHRNHIAHRFVVVGDGPMAAELIERCPDAIFLGKVTRHDLPEVFASADAFVYPSDEPSGCTSLLEAQASGLPVLVSNGGNGRDHMRHGRTGYVYRSGDVAELAARLGAILVDRDHRRALGDGARRYACARTWQAALDPIYELYRRAVGAPPEAAPAFGLPLTRTEGHR